MKKATKRILLSVLALVLVMAAAVTAFAFDWSMKVGDTLTLMLSDTPYVSSDANVVQVRHDGGTKYTAVAVGPGTATVSGGSWMGNAQTVYVITVTGTAAQPVPTTPEPVPTAPEPVPTTPAPEQTTPSVPTTEQTAPSVPVVPGVKPTVPQGQGGNSQTVDQLWEMQQNMQGETGDFDKHFSTVRIITYCIFGLVLVLLILGIIMEIKAARFSKKTLGPKELPPLRPGPQTVTTPAALRSACPNCGQPYGDSVFCGRCGTPKQVNNVHHFHIPGKMYATEFEEMANAWFAQNPYVCNCKLHVTTDWTSFAFDPTRKFYITKASVEFNVAERPLPHRFGVAFLYKKRHFRSGSGEVLVDKWLESNRDCKVISWENSRISHWDNNALTYSLHYNVVLFQKEVPFQ